MSRSEIDSLKSRFADGVQNRLRSGGERQSGRYSDIYDFESPRGKKTPAKNKSMTSDKKKARSVKSPSRATRATSPRRAVSPRRATSPRPRTIKKKTTSTPSSKSAINDEMRTFKTPKSASKNAPSTSTPKSKMSVKKRKSDDDIIHEDDFERTNDTGSKKRKREADSDAKTPKKRSSTVRKRVSFRGDELDSNSHKDGENEAGKNDSWWFCSVM